MSVSFDPYHKWLGIPADEQPPDLYRLLAIARFETDDDAISNAADQRMAHVRTFQTGAHAAESQRLLNELSAARLELLDPVKRATYDDALRSKLAARTPAPPVAPPPAPKPMRRAQSLPARQAVVAASQGVDVVGSAYVSPSASRAGSSKRKRKPSTVVNVLMWGSMVPAIIGIVALAAHYLRNPGPAAAPAGTASTSAPGAPGKAAVNEPRTAEDDDAEPRSGVSVVPVGRLVNLLERVNPLRDSVNGQWGRDGNDLVSPPESVCVLQTDVVPPEEYELILEGERQSGTADVGIGLVCGGVSTLANLSSWNGSGVGLDVLDASVDANPSFHKTEPLLPAGKAFKITCTVKANSIQVVVNGRQVIDWTGDPSRLAIRADWPVAAYGRLLLTTHDTVVRYTRWDIKPLVRWPLRDPAEADKMFLSEAVLVDAQKLAGWPLRRPMTVAGRHSPHGVFLVPPETNRPSRAVYDIGGHYARVTGAVAIDHWAPRESSVKLTFRVLGDDRELWRSKPIASRDAAPPQVFDVDVSGVRKLELCVDCPGSYYHCLAAWFEPALFRKASLAETPRFDETPKMVVGRSINLLPYIQPDLDAIHAQWHFDGPVLLSPRVAHARLQIPVHAPEHYRLVVEGSRDNGYDLDLGLVVGGRLVTLVLDGWARQCSGLHLIDGRGGDQNSTSYRYDNLLGVMKPYTIDCRVHPGSVQVSHNGKQIINWSGNSSALSVSGDCNAPRHDALYLAGYAAVHRFTKVELTPLAPDDGAKETRRPADTDDPLAAAPPRTLTEAKPIPPTKEGEPGAFPRPPSATRSTLKPASKPRSKVVDQDLGTLVDVSRDSMFGQWIRQDGVLRTEGSSQAYLVMPFHVFATRYELQFKCKKRGLGLGCTLPLTPAGTAVALTMGGWDGQGVGIESVDGKLARDAGTVRDFKRLGPLRDDVEYRVDVDVSIKNAVVEIECALADDTTKEKFSWRLGAPGLAAMSFATSPSPSLPNLFARDAVVEFSDIRLKIPERTTSRPWVSDEKVPEASKLAAPAKTARLATVAFGTHHYFFSDAPVDFGQAVTLATRLGGDVLVIDSEEEFRFVLDQAKGRSYFLGVWMHGRPSPNCFVDSHLRPVDITHWGGGQPNFVRDESNLALYEDQRIHDVRWTDRHRYCIEWSGEE